MIFRLVERALRRYDSEERELVVRWRIWRTRWFPHRMITFDEERAFEALERDEIDLGDAHWELPDMLRYRRRRNRPPESQ